ncbi:4-aminobutyrate--2-oxoglutarate transaminase [Geovibrio thiophilus]|uniref:4-aminobutyrate--2-oxoglutarate transaminase n=1 Tax=Geovibrio thiophilus TaxID=139438 RepID=A0A410JZ50_9BACT|nr:4-aminobutyrate--2-oxoglutarate transaminase [Geovibrio thiophilus]QAR33476.1 4-aminobutyrate--2-oxoglutarate transaminase [Geovibrio thiophilus]
MLNGKELANISTHQSERTKKIIDDKAAYVAAGISCTFPLVVKQAKGAVIEDTDGNTYLDFYAGIGVTSCGHCPDEVVKAIKDQADKLLHSCFMVSMYEPYVRLAEKLTQIAPGKSSKKAMFVNSGAEAVENAIKIAKTYTKRTGVVAFESGFHGRTLLTMTLTSKVKPYKDGFGPFAPEVYKVPFPNVYRGQINTSEEEACRAYLDYFRRFFVSEVNPMNIAAVILEPVQGEGGFNVPPKGYWQGLREICDEYGIVLIADEVQSGFCRTGRMFAVEHFGVEPDLVTMAKSLGSGMPISAVVGKKEIMDSVGAGGIGGTYGGNPVACEAALASIRMMEEQNLSEKSLKIGAYIMDRARALQKEFPQMGDVRGLGAMIGIEFVKDPATKEPYKDAVSSINAECFKQGLLVIGAGIFGNVVRFLPPLVLTDEQLKQAMDIFESAVRKTLK